MRAIYTFQFPCAATQTHIVYGTSLRRGNTLSQQRQRAKATRKHKTEVKPCTCKWNSSTQRTGKNTRTRNTCSILCEHTYYIHTRNRTQWWCKHQTCWCVICLTYARAYKHILVQRWQTLNTSSSSSLCCENVCVVLRLLIILCKQNPQKDCQRCVKSCQVWWALSLHALNIVYLGFGVSRGVWRCMLP